ncbi:acetyl-CoA acetyltransferase [Sulfodiicoccus acidiphilus]|uniref:Acetyl-CoA acetyltransferase n=1 Tax=Sulfodiicoccus acidiphilus TaxID=1670455 RepID=A0A348B1M0_9CREN|nr:thiolase domain-containing protein [Sulfodiicoccus acidiphilus]BBD72072.1 acetyl-CoA acetyltransferase [Sulfodiicoccus acidiphilus]GGU05591.1 acetyl-CoA acetyltransferase [Sulfodiicoccus acidiphilus]
MRVGLVSYGFSGFAPSVSDKSFREMTFEAASKAYAKVGLNPRTDVDAFVSCKEDFWEGISITDEFAPDQLGGALKPVFTVTGDGLLGIVNAYMMIRTGAFDVVVVEAHGKPSEVKSYGDVERMSQDPIYVRPLNFPNYHSVKAVEAKAFMRSAKLTREDLGLYVSQTKRNGLLSSRAPHASDLSVDAYLHEEQVLGPLSESDLAPRTDASLVFVVASEAKARELSGSPVWLMGVGWASDYHTPSYRNLEIDMSARNAARMAFKLAGIEDPKRKLGFAEVDERYSFVALRDLVSMGLVDDVRSALNGGDLSREGSLPVNRRGGALSEGLPLEAHGLARLAAACDLLDGVGVVVSGTGNTTAVVVVTP